MNKNRSWTCSSWSGVLLRRGSLRIRSHHIDLARGASLARGLSISGYWTHQHTVELTSAELGCDWESAQRKHCHFFFPLWLQTLLLSPQMKLVHCSPDAFPDTVGFVKPIIALLVPHDLGESRQHVEICVSYITMRPTHQVPVTPLPSRLPTQARCI